MPSYRKTDRRKTPPESSIPPYSQETGTRLERRLNPDNRRKKDPLEFIGLFSGVPRHLAVELMERCIITEFSGGDLVLSPEQENDSIRILLSGRLKIHFGNKTSSEFIIVNQGECIGEMSIIDGKPVSAYVVADTDCRMMVIHQKEFWSSLSQIPGLARNLLAMLAERMRTSNQSVLHKLQKQMELEHIQKELSIAGNIQMSLLPAHPLFPDRKEVDLFALMHPTKHIGGDFYDAFFVSANKLFIAVGDVSGKGISAALYMVQSIMHLKTQALLDFSPHEILERVNNNLCKNNTSSMFVSLFCGILDTQTGLFVYTNAGHNPPLTDAISGTFEFMPAPPALVVGMMEDIKYKTTSVQLKPNDTIFVYTDGVTEAENCQKAMFTDDKLQRLLISSSSFSVRQLVEKVKNELSLFCDGVDQSDDITMLCLRFIGTESA